MGTVPLPESRMLTNQHPFLFEWVKRDGFLSSEFRIINEVFMPLVVLRQLIHVILLSVPPSKSSFTPHTVANNHIVKQSDPGATGIF
jgi:hypothetical protein